MPPSRWIGMSVATGVAWLALAGVAHASAASITATEGQGLTNVVVDSLSSCSRSPTMITIDWGDNTATSSGTAQPAGSGCDIVGSHTYSEEGSHLTKVQYTVPGGQNSDVGSATVGDAPLVTSPVTDFTLSAGSPLSAVVADWNDPALEPLSGYGASIDWGDGVSSAGTIANGTVSGGHTYVNGARYLITVTFFDEGGASAVVHEHAVVNGCPTAAPSTPSPSFNPPASALNARYVQALYHDLLGRNPTPAELTNTTSALSLGATRGQLAASLVGSTEYRTDLIAAAYQAYLHRSPGASETSTWLAFLGGGASDQALLAALFGSSEYYANRGNSSVDGFLGALYCDQLYRSIDQFAQNNDDAALGSGTPRGTVASGVLASSESLAHLVNGYYLHYLRRPATTSELAAWATLIKGGRTDEQVIGSLVSSTEYFELFNPKVAIATTSLAQGGTISTTLSRAAALRLTVLRVVPTGHAVTTIVNLPHTRQVGVVDFGRHHKGRVKLRWNRRVGGKRLKPGRYVLLLKAYAGHKLIGVSDALPFTLR